MSSVVQVLNEVDILNPRTREVVNQHFTVVKVLGAVIDTKTTLISCVPFQEQKVENSCDIELGATVVAEILENKNITNFPINLALYLTTFRCLPSSKSD